MVGAFSDDGLRILCERPNVTVLTGAVISNFLIEFLLIAPFSTVEECTSHDAFCALALACVVAISSFTDTVEFFSTGLEIFGRSFASLFNPNSFTSIGVSGDSFGMVFMFWYRYVDDGDDFGDDLSWDFFGECVAAAAVAIVIAGGGGRGATRAGMH